MYGKNDRAGVADGAVCSTIVVAAVAHAFDVSSSVVTQREPVNAWYRNPSVLFVLIASAGFFVFLIVRRSFDQVLPRSVDLLTWIVQSVPAAPPTRSAQAHQITLELCGSTATERSPPSRSCPIVAFHLTKRLGATTLPFAPR